MKSLIIPRFSLVAFYLLLLILASACKKDGTDEFPITNDLRVLQVKLGSQTINSGAIDLSVIPEFELIFSHGLNASAFEGALSISPSAIIVATYDNTNSFAKLSFSNPLEYETTYTILLPTGVYGANGEASVEDFSFEFTTAAFEPPSITLSSDVSSFFEGETATVTATLNRSILQNVSFDFVFGGSAMGAGTDYTASASSITIPSGSTTASVDLVSINEGVTEGEEIISVTITNLVNAVEEQPQQVDISLGDQAPALELKGVMELDNYIGGTDGRVRAIHLHVLEDIPNLGIYGVEIASNGATPDPMDIDFTFPDMTPATAGDDLFIIRDADEANAMAYFGSCFSDFTIFLSDAITQNGDDAILLYLNDIAIESFGEPGVDGTGEIWEYTDSWAYKLGEEWIYPGADCIENGGGETDATTVCKYPFCTPIQLQGVSALLWDGSGTNGGKAVHVRANKDIADLSQYSLGVANNGGGTDGIEFTFPAMSVNEGDQLLVSREPGTIASYFGNCYDQFDQVFQADAMSQNGDDAIELFDGMDAIETYGDANVDGTGQAWEYAGSWAYRTGVWTYGGVACAAGSTSTQSSACPYAFCE